MPELHVLYRYFDTDDNLLYVGITNSPLNRMGRHYRDKAWFKNAARTTYEHFPSRADLEAAEVKAIQEEKPKYNIAHSVAPVPRTIGVPSRAVYSYSPDANRFQAPDAIASDDEVTDDERAVQFLELERATGQYLQGKRCPSCELLTLSREYDDLIKCGSCLNMFTPDEIPSDLEILMRAAKEKK